MANELARDLRKRLTPQEVKLWVKLRELKTRGYHFRRQAPVGRYIVDFLCISARLVIEADGGQHGLPDGERRDRTAMPISARKATPCCGSGIRTSTRTCAG